MNFDQTFQTKPANETTAEQMLITRAQSAVVTSISPLARARPGGKLSFRAIFPHIPENARTLQEPILARLAFCRRGGRVGMLIDCLGRKLGGAGGSFCGRTSCWFHG